MTKYVVSIIHKDNSHESLALFDSKCSIESMIDFGRAVAVDPSLGAKDAYVMDMDTGEILWNIEDEDEYYPDDWDDEVGFNPYEGCYDYDC